MKPKAMTPEKHRPSRPRTARRTLALGLLLLGSTAFAAGGQIGSGLIAYVSPIILFLGVGAVVTALVGSAVGMRPEGAKAAWFAAAILIVVFFILRNTSALQAAVQGG